MTRRRPAEVTLETLVSDAAKSDWRAAAWLLERRWPERWSRSKPVVPEPVVEADGLDELASKRDARRAGR